MQLHDLTALEQGAAIRRGETSSAELVEHYLARIAQHDEALGAFVTVTADLARERAAGALPPGPLSGVPTAIKDLNATAGVRTMFGSRVHADFVPDWSDEVVLRMEAAGLVSLGKTNTPEFGSPCYTESDVAPPAVSPWDTTRMAGGSSGGAAAAVAGGLTAVAQGSDGGGSIRTPASCCGLVGLKPTRGRVSGAPVYGEVTGLATGGPLARTVRDAAALLDVLAGPAVGEPWWAPPPETSFLSACDRPPGRLRVGRFVEPVLVEAEVDPGCVAAWERASRLLAELGHEVVDIPAPLTPDRAQAFLPVWRVLTALSTSVLSEEQRALLTPYTRWLGEQGEQVGGPAFGLALGEMRRVAADALVAVASYDVVLTPTIAQLPAKVGALRDDADPARDFADQMAFTPWTSLWNVTGSPAVSLPLHHQDGLPVGVMLAARPAREDVLLSLAAQVEEAAPWRDRKPPVW